MFGDVQAAGKCQTSRVNFNLRTLGHWVPVAAWPSFPCSVCGVGVIELSPDPTGKTNGSLHLVEAAESKRDREHPRWEPTWIWGKFHAVLTCTRRACAEIAIATGEYSVKDRVTPPAEPFIDRWTKADLYEDFLLLRYLDPPVRLLAVPEGTPDRTKQYVEEAAALIWVSPDAAANTLRRAVEALLDALGVPSTESSGKPISPHRRIKRLAATNQEVADVLLAVKWVGNDGSHVPKDLAAAPLDAAVCIEAAEHLEYALNLLYPLPDPAAAIQARVAAINRNETGRTPAP